MNKALVVIDAQNDFTYLKLRNEEAIKALPTLHEVVNYASENFSNIYYTRDCHDRNTYFDTQEGKNLPVLHCDDRTMGYDLCDEAIPDKGTATKYYIDKSTFSYNWFNHYDIKEADEIWLCGFCTDICVSANFQNLKMCYPETPIVVIEDACAGVTPELHEAALKVMKSCQARIVKWADLEKENV